MLPFAGNCTLWIVSERGFFPVLFAALLHGFEVPVFGLVSIISTKICMYM